MAIFSKILTTKMRNEDHEATGQMTKITYTRDFLLSITGLDICKELPSGVELSNLCESGDIPRSLFDHRKDRGLLNTPSGSQIGSFSGTWDSHSSRWDNRVVHILGTNNSDGRDDGDESQSSRQNENCQLSKSDKPYQPPHSYKAAPKEKIATETCTKETSSYAERLNTERVDEEKERTSFELVRKKEQKAVKEKQRKSSTHPSILKHPDVEANKAQRPMLLSSKFPLWFLEEHNLNFEKEVKKPTGGRSSVTMEILSQVSSRFDGIVTENYLATSSQDNEVACKLRTCTSSSAEAGASEQLFACNAPVQNQGIVTCQELEQSIVSVNNIISATKHHFALGQGICDMGNEQLNSKNDDGASLCYSSMLRKGLPSSKHKMPSFQKQVPVVETDSSVALIPIEGDDRNSEKSQNLQSSLGMDFMKYFDSYEEPISVQIGWIDRVSGSVISKSGGFPFSVADYNFLTSIADEKGSIGTNFEGIRIANVSEISKLDNAEANQSAFDDDWDEIVSMIRMEQESELFAITDRDETSGSMVQMSFPDEDSLITVDDLLIPQQPKFMPDIAQNDLQTRQESKFSPVASFDESTFDYCLPDEESLITFDDLITPQHSVSISGGKSKEDDMLPSDVKDDVSDKLLAPNIVQWDERSTTPNGNGVLNVGNSCENQHAEQSYPKFCQCCGSSFVHSLDSHQPQMNYQAKFNTRKTRRTPPHRHHLTPQSWPSGRTTWPLLPDPPVSFLSWYPLVFPTQPFGFPPIVFPPVQMLPSIYQLPDHEGFRMPNSDTVGYWWYNNNEPSFGS